MAEYCSESDLIKIRPKILELGVTDWTEQIAEASDIIDRAIEVKWYRRIAEENNVNWRTTLFDRDMLKSASTQIKRVGCYKALELIFMYLMKHRADDAFEKEREMFSKLYKEEMHEVLLAGLDYDWDDDDLDSDEISVPRVRRLMRA